MGFVPAQPVTQLHDLTALEQGAQIASGQVSATELLDHYLDRIDRLGATVGAYLTMTPELAREQAAAADQRVREGATGLSPLHGVVIPIKDLHLAAGVRCTLGSTVYDFVPQSDDNAVAKMRSAGLVFPGTTNTPEFGLPCYTENEIAPPARTPWDLDRSAGGSSGGAAAAVATGLAAAAQGSDGGGSIRIPASVTGLVGLKPSRGRVSGGPLPEAVGELVVIGPLARTVADAAALLDVLAGYMPGDIFPAPATGEGAFLAAARREPGRLRIGRYCTPVIADTTLDPQVLAAYEEATALLLSLGHEVFDIEPPFGLEALPHFEAIWATLAAMTPVPADRVSELTPLTAWLREQGEQVSGQQLAIAVSTLRLLARQSRAATEHLDAVLTPTLAKLPAMVGGLRNDADPAADFAAQTAFTPFTSPYNMTGQPAISVPLCWTSDGLPIGVQLIGRLYDEATLISLAAQLEQAQPWRQRRHELW